MGPIVVEDQMHVQPHRDRRLNRVEKLPELPRPMSVMELPNDSTCCHFQDGEERRGAMAAVVVRAAFYLPRTHWQQRACPIQRLNLRFFIHTQDEGLIWGMQIEADHNAHLLDKQQVGRQLERLRAMGLQAEGSPDAMHRTCG